MQRDFKATGGRKGPGLMPSVAGGDMEIHKCCEVFGLFLQASIWLPLSCFLLPQLFLQELL